MSFASRETSQAAGAPVELYDFAQGVNHYRFTSGDAAQVYLGNTYAANYIKRTQVDQSQEQEAGAVEIDIEMDNSMLTMFKNYLPDSEVTLTVFRNHRGDSDFQPVFIGTVDSVQFSPGMAKLTCNSIFNKLKREVPYPRYQRQCNHMLYSSGCGVVEGTFTVTGTLSAVSGADITSTTFGTKPNGWFNNGWVLWGTQRRFVLNHVGNVITTITPFAGISAGQSVSAVAGCARSESDCIGKFNNIANFFGFPRIPQRTPMEGV